MRSIAFGGTATVVFIRTILTPEDARPSAVTIAAHGKPRARAARPLPRLERLAQPQPRSDAGPDRRRSLRKGRFGQRSEEHTSELQSRVDLVCRLLLEKKKRTRMIYRPYMIHNFNQ